MGCRPALVPGTTIELGFLGTVLRVEFPQDLDEQQLGNSPNIQTQTDQDWHVRSGCSFSSNFCIVIRSIAASCLFVTACHTEYDPHLRGFILASLVYLGVSRIMRADYYLRAVPCMDKQRNLVAPGCRPTCERLSLQTSSTYST